MEESWDSDKVGSGGEGDPGFVAVRYKGGGRKWQASGVSVQVRAFMQGLFLGFLGCERTGAIGEFGGDKWR